MSKFRFDEKARKVTTLKSQLLIKMGNEAVNYFKIKVFDDQGFDGQSWKPRKDGDASRKLLVKTGHLRQSIRVMGKGLNFIRIGTDIPYAQYHNKGTDKLPKREFIGESKVLTKKLNQFIVDYVRRVGRRGKFAA